MPCDLHRSDRPVHQQQVADEPRRGHQHTAGLKRAAQQVPAGQKRNRGRRDLAGPPAVGHQLGCPPPGEEEAAERDERDDEPPGAW